MPKLPKRGGGILNSADKLHEMSEDDLYEQSMKRVREVCLKALVVWKLKADTGLIPKMN